MIRCFAPLLFLLSLPVAAESFTLTAEDWARPRSGATLTHQPALASVMRAFERERDGVIVIGHATGEAGQLWAAELRDWLVALGVSSARIRFDARPGLQEGALMLDVRQRDSL